MDGLDVSARNMDIGDVGLTGDSRCELRGENERGVNACGGLAMENDETTTTGVRR